MAAYGKVHFVGTCCGRADFTLSRGISLLAAADAVICLHPLVDPLLRHAGANVEMLRKESPELLARQLLGHIRQGRKVAVLSANDPLYDAEALPLILACSADGVPFDIVPAIPPSFAAASACGIILQNPDMARSLLILHGPFDFAPAAIPPHERETADGGQHQPRGGVVVNKRRKEALRDSATGLRKLSGDKPAIPPMRTDWLVAARAADTLVIHGAADQLASVGRALLQGGRPADEAVAIFLPSSDKPLFKLTSMDLLAATPPTNVPADAVLVIGDIVGLRSQCTPTGDARGIRIAALMDDELSAATREALEPPGVSVDYFTAFDWTPMRGVEEAFALLEDDLRCATDIVYTSLPAARVLHEILRHGHHDLRIIPSSARLYAEVQEAHDLVRDAGLNVELLDGRDRDTALLSRLSGSLDGRRVLLLAGIAPRPMMVAELRRRGAAVTEVPLIDWRHDLTSMGRFVNALRDSRTDLAVITGSQAAGCLVQFAHDNALDLSDLGIPVLADQSTVPYLRKLRVRAIHEIPFLEPSEVVEFWARWHDGTAALPVRNAAGAVPKPKDAPPS